MRSSKSRCESWFGDHFRAMVKQLSSLAYTQVFTARIRVARPSSLPRSSAAEQGAVNSKVGGADPPAAATFIPGWRNSSASVSETEGRSAILRPGAISVRTVAQQAERTAGGGEVAGAEPVSPTIFLGSGVTVSTTAFEAVRWGCESLGPSQFQSRGSSSVSRADRWQRSGRGCESRLSPPLRS